MDNNVFEYAIGEEVKVDMGDTNYEAMEKYKFTNDTLFTVHSREIDEDDVHWYTLKSPDGDLFEADGSSIYK